jgi:site-specific DNA-cytosine methylase
MSSAPLDKQPKAILLFAQAIHLEMESGAASKTHRKSMEKLGYSIHFWLMEAGDFGSAVSKLRLRTSCTQETSDQPQEPKRPSPNKLPVRPMSDLLMPVGVPFQHGLR